MVVGLIVVIVVVKVMMMIMVMVMIKWQAVSGEFEKKKR